MSEPNSLPDRIAQFEHALTAVEISELLGVSRILIYKLAKSHRLPCFRIGSAVRFCPKSVADWLRKM